ncbi:hypothetical protein [Synechococcus sp. PCC 6312]|uniref:hypothetical protein n=1 Tax=Synechococcus sp. (strain ATCC 27167 / PCC 6312) TaxID=195253 RepID=UPI0012E9F3D4|nr:hypothetical protein [Synechococcus sp. PCC 6312]
MNLETSEVRCFPASKPVYSPAAVLEFYQAGCDPTQPLIMVAYSAGVVGGLGAAQLWQKLGGIVGGVVVIDAWGVPLWGNFPLVTVSHDWITDVCGQAWGKRNHFLAQPAVTHAQLWQSPQSAWGLGTFEGQTNRQTAKTFIQKNLEQFRNRSEGHEEDKISVWARANG